MAVKDDVEIVKARIDKRDYRRVVLRNSLQVLLISDPVTDKVDFLFDLWFRFRFGSDSLFFFFFRFNSLAHFMILPFLCFDFVRCSVLLPWTLASVTSVILLASKASPISSVFFSFFSFDSILSRIGFDLCRILVDVLRVWRGFLVWSLVCCNCSL